MKTIVFLGDTYKTKAQLAKALLCETSLLDGYLHGAGNDHDLLDRLSAKPSRRTSKDDVAFEYVGIKYKNAYDFARGFAVPLAKVKDALESGTPLVAVLKAYARPDRSLLFPTFGHVWNGQFFINYAAAAAAIGVQALVLSQRILRCGMTFEEAMDAGEKSSLTIPRTKAVVHDGVRYPSRSALLTALDLTGYKAFISVRMTEGATIEQAIEAARARKNIYKKKGKPRADRSSKFGPIRVAGIDFASPSHAFKHFEYEYSGATRSVYKALRDGVDPDRAFAHVVLLYNRRKELEAESNCTPIAHAVTQTTEQ